MSLLAPATGCCLDCRAHVFVPRRQKERGRLRCGPCLAALAGLVGWSRNGESPAWVAGRVRLYADRYAAGLDLWSGRPRAVAGGCR